MFERDIVVGLGITLAAAGFGSAGCKHREHELVHPVHPIRRADAVVESPPPVQAPPPAPITSTASLTLVPTPSSFGMFSSSGILNQWLLDNPDKRVTSITVMTGVNTALQYPMMITKYLVGHVQGENRYQRFFEIYADANKPESWEGEYGIKELDDWAAAHKGFKVVSFAPVPGGSGGAYSWLICAEPSVTGSSELGKLDDLIHFPHAP